ncbi:arginine--tRNA ligase [Actinomyces sp. zg-332]|uniref:arginine--tRNA ligase n=1 Tax=Actinomyces sp. zg-332 TaxID=2708340 RepID=UPI00141D9EF8|nr:arginine--tRNA ligase [Actinomyces sp. zg-332]QPK94492.1 arginine--tRNA ligase [Actinomyces sp. zg-332]
MTPEQLSAFLKTIIEEIVSLGQTNLQESDIPETVKIERPRQRQHGDWATNIAMQLGKKAGFVPRDFAQVIADKLFENAHIEKVEIAGPGFLNITLVAGAAGSVVDEILSNGENYGKNNFFAGKNINLEFVSANPTGPIHLGGARWAAVGDTLARLLEFSGGNIVREYYFNDHGAQIDRFAKSLIASAKGLEAPEDGYGGQYIHDIAQQIKIDYQRDLGTSVLDITDDEELLEVFRSRGVTLMFDEIKKSLHDFGVDFDVYFHEDSLHESGRVDKAVEILRSQGVIKDEDGAIWVETTKFGDDKDRVIIKSDGNAAYFAGDIAYYLDKKERGTDKAIILLGADHHGYVGRMMAMCAAYGDTPHENLEIIIGQMVNLYSGGQPVRMSKRAGTIVTLEDLVEAVGVDAARYSLARSSMDSEIDIDLDLLTSHSNENPVYYLQYAHARTCSVKKKALEYGIGLEESFDASCLSSESDLELLATLSQFPQIVLQSAQMLEQHRIVRYLESLAAAYHTWYAKCRVTPKEGETKGPEHVARLYLNEATSQVLKNGLSIVGVSAPEKM